MMMRKDVHRPDNDYHNDENKFRESACEGVDIILTLLPEHDIKRILKEPNCGFIIAEISF